ncbi:MAG TPA: UrcA family protein [Steroidobacteraceae bacterium]|nr:UrcA family protein [Steroidobacteraceae bacterium]
MNTPNLNPRSAVRPIALALILGLIGVAQASAGEPAGIRVPYGDLDLATSAGAHTLYERIAGAARTVCGFEGTSLIEQSLWNSCYRGAISEAVAKVNRPLLSAVPVGRPAHNVAMLGN